MEDYTTTPPRTDYPRPTARPVAHPVSSRPITAPRPVQDILSWYAIGIVSLLVGFGFWLVGARFTVMGAPRVIQTALSLFSIDLVIPLPAGWPLLVLTVFVGAVMSCAEFGCFPRRAFFSRSLLFGLALALIWFTVNAGDFASTYVGVTTPQPDSWPLTRWIAETAWIAGVWSLFLTYIPELLMMGGLRWVVRGGF